jgi:hypothetical protein
MNLLTPLKVEQISNQITNPPTFGSNTYLTRTLLVIVPNPVFFFSGYIPQIVIITRLATSSASLAQTSSSISETTTSPVPRTQGLWCRGNKYATRPPPLPSTGHVSHLIFSELANTNPPYNIPNFWWYLSTP